MNWTPLPLGSAWTRTLRGWFWSALATAVAAAAPSASEPRHVPPTAEPAPVAATGAAFASRIGTSLRQSGEDFGTEEFELEYRFPWRGPLDLGLDRLAPVLGASGTEEDSTYFYAGLRYDFDLGAGWRITPSLVAGSYDQGEGRDIGGALQFRSQLELSTQVSERLRVGLSAHHVSNSNLGEVNPGAEFFSFVAVWHL